MKCDNCESSNIALKNIKGRRFVYKNQGSISITVDLELPVCLECETLILKTAEDKLKVDNALLGTINQKNEQLLKIRCGNCGSKNLKRENRKGHFYPYLDHDKAQLKLDLFLPVCQDCRMELLLNNDSEDLYFALDQSMFSSDIVANPCLYCSGETQLINFDYESNQSDYKTGKKIVVTDASYWKCLNIECNHEWMDQAQEDLISEEVTRKSRMVLSQDEIKKLVEKIGYKTKGTLIQKLGLNSQVFMSSFNGNSTLPYAYDVLLRLLAHDSRNVDFLNELDSKQFAFDEKDYKKKE